MNIKAKSKRYTNSGTIITTFEGFDWRDFDQHFVDSMGALFMNLMGVDIVDAARNAFDAKSPLKLFDISVEFESAFAIVRHSWQNKVSIVPVPMMLNIVQASNWLHERGHRCEVMALYLDVYKAKMDMWRFIKRVNYRTARVAAPMKNSDFGYRDDIPFSAADAFHALTGG